MPAARQGHPQGVQDEAGAHVAGELPADDPPAVNVDHEREEHQAFPAAQVGEVGDPQLIRARRGEVALDQVRCAAGCRVAARGSPGLAAPLGALDPVCFHEAPDTVAADWFAGSEHRFPGAPRPVGVVVARAEDDRDPVTSHLSIVCRRQPQS